jgi:N-carbamoyl-L-amino-acid hydrolase
MDLKKMRVNGKRLQSTLEQMAKIGGTPGGGVQRLALSDEDKEARDLFVRWLKESGCRITIDEMGNIFGLRPGRNKVLAPVMSGSHIDSQPKGGRFDGILGVMGALEVLRTLHENDVQTERPMVIVRKVPALPRPWWVPASGPGTSNSIGPTTARILPASA